MRSTSLSLYSQFNRYYMIAVCRYAVQVGKEKITVYRAQGSIVPRRESESLIGSSINARKLADELIDLDKSFRSALLKPNSGLSVMF